MIFLCVVLAAMACAFAYYEYKIDMQETAKRQKAASEVRVFSLQRDEKQKQLDALKAEFEAFKLPKTPAQFLFLGCDRQVFVSAYPILANSDVPGMLLLSLNELPGDPGNMSMEEFQELMDMGWDYAVAFDYVEDDPETYDVVEDWDTAIAEALSNIGLAMPKTIYYHPGEYSIDENEFLLDEYSVVIHHGEDNMPMVNARPEPLWPVGARDWKDNEAVFEGWMADAVGQRGEIVITVSLTNLNYLEDVFSPLQDIITYYRPYGVYFCSLADARAVYSPDLEQVQATTLDYETRISILEEEIANLKAEIDAVHDKYGV